MKNIKGLFAVLASIIFSFFFVSCILFVEKDDTPANGVDNFIFTNFKIDELPNAASDNFDLSFTVENSGGSADKITFFIGNDNDEDSFAGNTTYGDSEKLTVVGSFSFDKYYASDGLAQIEIAGNSTANLKMTFDYSYADSPTYDPIYIYFDRDGDSFLLANPTHRLKVGAEGDLVEIEKL